MSERFTLDDFNTIPSGLPLAVGADLADLLDAVEVFLRRYVVVDEAQATALSLWVVHTHAIEAAFATPYLFVSSAEPESGKTRLLEVLYELVREPLLTVSISDAALFRTINLKQPTLFFDEVDAVFSAKAQERGHREDLRALLNAGYRRGQKVFRMGGNNRTTLEEFLVFGAKALAGLGSLPPSLASRCLRIELKRRRLTEPVDDFYPDEVAAEAGRLREELAGWAEVAVETLKAARPARVEGVRDRTMEVWRPLLAIAELDGEPWAARARRAVLALSGGDAEDPSLGLLLLEDVRTVFDEQNVERIATAALIAALAGSEESPWAGWWLDPQTETPNRGAPRRLAQLLRPYGVRSQTIRIGEETAKGYRREDFLDAWERFLASRVDASQASHPSQPSQTKETGVTDVTDVTHRRDGSWLARDGVWRSYDTDPPAFAGEVIDTREGEQ